MRNTDAPSNHQQTYEFTANAQIWPRSVRSSPALSALFPRVHDTDPLPRLRVAQQRTRRRLRQHLPRRRGPRLEQRPGSRLHQRLLVDRAVLHRVRRVAEPGRLRDHRVHVRDDQLGLSVVCGLWDCVVYTGQSFTRCIPYGFSVLCVWEIVVCCNPILDVVEAVHLRGLYWLGHRLRDHGNCFRKKSSS